MQKVGCVRALGSPGHQCTDHPCDVRGDGGNDDNPERTGELVENEGGDQYASPGGNISRVDPFCQTEADDGCLGINPQLESQGDGGKAGEVDGAVGSQGHPPVLLGEVLGSGCEAQLVLLLRAQFLERHPLTAQRGR